MQKKEHIRKNHRFFIYRYQILARIDPQQPLFYSTPNNKTYSSVEELRSAKNEIFFEMLDKIELDWIFGEISQQTVYEDNETKLLRIAVNRPKKLGTEDFKNQLHNDWPWIFLYIDNNPRNQYLVIEIDRDAWAKTDITVKMLRENFNKYLEPYFLMVEINPIIEHNAFWEFVEKYKGRIEVVEFDMISPNMSNISQKSKWPLREIRDQYNATRQKVRLENNIGTSLDIKRDPLTESMAEYSSEGGGLTKFKIKKVKGYRTLSGDKIRFEFDDISYETDNQEHFSDVAKIIKGLIEGLVEND